MNIKGKVVIILGGKTGLLGQALTKALKKAEAKPIPLSSKECDILAPYSVETILNRHDPDLLINAAGYTQVDLAEDREEMAFALNSTAPPLMATLAAKRRIPFIHYSTDFVFQGDKRTPYSVYDSPAPYSIYGISKAEGEHGLLQLGYDQTLIIRTSWLFGPGKTNFVEKMITLSKSRESISVVDDQTGSPSYAPDVAVNTLKLIEHDATGIYHLANSGQTTWYGLAAKAIELAGTHCIVEPIPSSAYPMKAVRPAYSVLDLSRFIQTTGSTPRMWKEALKNYVFEELQEGSYQPTITS